VTRPQPEAPTLRDATLYDVPQLGVLDLICFPDHAFPSETIQRFIELGQPCVVTEDPASGGVIAFAMLLPEPEEGTGALMTIDVDPDHRRQGLGTHLVRWCAEHLLGMEVPMWLIWITVATRNEDALAFYRTLGFRQVDTIEGYYKDDDAIVMVHNDLEDLASDNSRGR
jgi:ribosomal protein S18 acetylase RimI-like enzyme